MKVEEVIRNLEPLIKNLKTKGYWKEKWWANEERIQALTYAIEVLQRIDMDGIKNIIEKARWECNVEIINGMATNKAAENYARAVIKYLKGEK